MKRYIAQITTDNNRLWSENNLDEIDGRRVGMKGAVPSMYIPIIVPMTMKKIKRFILGI